MFENLPITLIFLMSLNLAFIFLQSRHAGNLETGAHIFENTMMFQSALYISSGVGMLLHLSLLVTFGMKVTWSAAITLGLMEIFLGAGALAAALHLTIGFFYAVMLGFIGWPLTIYLSYRIMVEL